MHIISQNSISPWIYCNAEYIFHILYTVLMGEKMFCGYEPKTSKMSLPRTERVKRKKKRIWGTSPVWDLFYTSFNWEIVFLFSHISAAISEDLPPLCEMFWYASITATWLTAVIATWDPPEPKQLQGPVFLWICVTLNLFWQEGRREVRTEML